MKGEVSVRFPQEGRAASSSSSSPSSPLNEDKPAGEADPRVLSRLKDFRREEASRKKVPAYVIFHDKTLVALAAIRPQDETALSKVSGLGPKKMELYAHRILELVNENDGA